MNATWATAGSTLAESRDLAESGEAATVASSADDEKFGVDGADEGVVTVRLSEVSVGQWSPRSAGEDQDHVELLAAVEQLPPILVHRETLQVIDGHHRLKAAKLRGDSTIDVVLFDGDHSAALVAAVSANVRHGLLLPLLDRKAAVARIVAAYPQWSDRKIAQQTGLSPRTVAGIRRPTADSDQLDSRLGQDGKLRPTDPGQRRRQAAQYIEQNPAATLRQIADAAGISPETARDVRQRIQCGQNPGTSRHVAADESISRPRANGRPAPAGGRRHDVPDPDDPVEVHSSLCTDPSLAHNEAGRTLLRTLGDHARAPRELLRLINGTSGHTRPQIARLASAIGNEWQELARGIRDTRTWRMHGATETRTTTRS